MPNCQLIQIEQIACPNCKEKLWNNIKVNEGGFPAFADIFPETIVHSTGYSEFEEYPQQCISCALPINIDVNEKGELAHFDYPGDLLLAIQDRQAFLDWKKKQLNGWISVSLLARASCSIEGNLGALEYADYIKEIIHDGEIILDVGCGNQKMPSYFLNNNVREKTIVGLDPFPSIFSGSLVRGVAEFLPFIDSSIDVVNCASTIDHFMNLDIALIEICRVIKPEGVLIIWDHSGAATQDITPKAMTRMRQKIKRNQIRKFRIYEKGVVFKLENYNDDPFHSVLSRQSDWAGNLKIKLENMNFELVDQRTQTGFSIWRKTS
jgi:SAM-dependent methyltransferase